MRALQLRGLGQLVEDDIPLPVIHPGERLVKVSHCALCRTDAKIWRSGHRDALLPRVLGHEVCVSCMATGERFVVWPGDACGACASCRQGAENLCRGMRIMGFHRDGGLAEFAAVPASSLIPVPEGLPAAVACLAEPLACALNALEGAQSKAADRVLIYGAGPVGLLVGLAARSRGSRAVMYDISSDRLQRSVSFRERLEIPGGPLEEGGEADVVVNACPSLDAVLSGLERLASGGSFCLFSGLQEPGAVPLSYLNLVHYRQIHLVGAYGCTRRQMADAVRLLLQHAEAVALLIEKHISLADVPGVLPAILASQVFKVVVALDRAPTPPSQPTGITASPR
jgi:threonine dehydrogenase-like Zn-dependent dehydrogenase